MRIGTCSLTHAVLKQSVICVVKKLLIPRLRNVLGIVKKKENTFSASEGPIVLLGEKL